MDQVFAQLAMSTATMVGRAAFGVASQAALRRLHEYYRDGRHAIASAPTSATTLDVPSSLTSGTGSMPLATATATATATHEYAAGTRTTRPHTDPRNTWHALQRELDLKLSAVTPAIDLLEMVAVRGVGRSVLEPVMAMAGEVRGEVERLARGVVAASGAATTRRASVSGTASGTDATTSIADAMARVSLDSEPPTSTSARRRSIAVGKGFDTDTRNADEEILQATRHLIAKIDTLLPYLTMAVSMTGSKMDMSLSSVVSTGRLQRAAHLLSVASVHAASSSGASSRESGVRATTSTTTAAPLSYTPVISLMVRVYTLFIGSVRKSNIQWTWKEQMVKAELMVERRRVVVPADAGEPGRDDISYRLRIMQDLDDGRYHDGNDDDMPQKCTFDVVQIEKMYFSSSGKLLLIEDAKRPTLVLKVLKAGVAESRRASRESISRESLDSEGNVSSATSGAPLGASSSTPRTPSRRQQQQQQRADDASAPEPHIRDYDWYALELYAGNASDSDGSASDDSEGEEEEDVTPKKATSLSLPARRTTKGKTKKPARQKSITAQHVRPQPPFSNPIPADLSTLDYLLRLAALESREQLPLWDIADEKISFALAGDEKKLAASAMSGEDDREGDRRSIAATAEEERAVAESPLARKALPSSTSRRRSTLHK